jgi:hypothetical protein
MLLIIALVLLVLFAGLGFAVHVLWFGLIFALIFAAAAAITNGR